MHLYDCVNKIYMLFISKSKKVHLILMYARPAIISVMRLHKNPFAYHLLIKPLVT